MLAAARRSLIGKTPRKMNANQTRASSGSSADHVATQPFVKLNTGAMMPQLGLGTWQSKPGEVKEAIKVALRAGYRHFDCAAIYENEREVGEGLKEGLAECGLKRSDIWVTSKLWNTSHRPDLVKVACEQTLHDLGLNYLDLYLMHWPVDQIPSEGPKVGGDPTATETPIWETYDAMNELVTEGLAKAIGVSNFNMNELEELIKDTDLVPAVNQIEMHPYLLQTKLMEFCASKGITITGYSPLGRGGAGTKGVEGASSKGSDLPPLIEHPTVKKIAEKRGKSAGQVLIRWALQHDAVSVPKSVTPERIQSNFEVFNFILDEQDMKDLDGLNKKHRYVRPSFHDFSNDPEEL